MLTAGNLNPTDLEKIVSFLVPSMSKVDFHYQRVTGNSRILFVKKAGSFTEN